MNVSAQAAVQGVGFIDLDRNTPSATFTTVASTENITITTTKNNVDDNYIRWGLYTLNSSMPKLGQTHLRIMQLV